MLVDFFRVGFDRFKYLALILLCSVALCQDAAILSAIEDVNSELQSLNSKADNLATLDDISLLLSSIQSNQSSSYSKIQQIQQILSQVYISYAAGYGAIQVQDDHVYDRLDMILNLEKKTQVTITNQLGDILLAFDSLEETINNFTNYVSLSAGYFPTNWPAATVPPFGDGYDDAMAGEFFHTLYGRYPTSTELRWFRYVNQTFSVYDNFLFDTVSHLDLLVLLEDQEDIFDAISEQFMRVGLPDLGSSPQFELGQAYYYQYGTRPLLDFFQNATNDFPLSYTDDAVIEDQLDDDGNQVKGFSSKFVDTVETVSTSFLPAISNNVASISTNEIEKVPDNSFKSFGQDLLTYDNQDLENMVSLINHSEVFDDIVESLGSASPSEFRFDFNLTSLNSSAGNVSLVVSNTTGSTRPLVHYVSMGLKVAITIGFIGMAWQRIIKPSPLFFP